MAGACWVWCGYWSAEEVNDAGLLRWCRWCVPAVHMRGVVWKCDNVCGLTGRWMKIAVVNTWACHWAARDYVGHWAMQPPYGCCASSVGAVHNNCVLWTRPRAAWYQVWREGGQLYSCGSCLDRCGCCHTGFQHLLCPDSVVSVLGRVREGLATPGRQSWLSGQPACCTMTCQLHRLLH